VRKSILWLDNQHVYLQPHISTLEADYEVVTTSSVQEVIELLRADPTCFDLLILDVLMERQPIGGRQVVDGLSGLTLYRVLREDLSVTAPLIFVTVVSPMSGVFEPLAAEEARRGRELTVVQKPMSPRDVVTAVRAILGP